MKLTLDGFIKRGQSHHMNKPLTKSEKTELLQKISREATDCTVLSSDSWENVEVWNLVPCWIQNAEMDGNDLITHVECALCDESPEVGKYFRAIGFNF